MATSKKKTDIATKIAHATPADRVFEEINARPEVQAERAEHGHRYLLADLMSTFRSLRNLTQEELATAIGTTQPQIAKWESGKGNPTWDNVVSIFKALGVSAAFANAEAQMQMVESSRLNALHALAKAAADKETVPVPRAELERLRQDSQELARVRDNLDEALLNPESVEQTTRIFQVL